MLNQPYIVPENQNPGVVGVKVAQVCSKKPYLYRYKYRYRYWYEYKYMYMYMYRYREVQAQV